jgi:segregation and condensation protein B
MARRKRTDAEPPIFDAELVDMPADLRWREWMNRIEAVLFAVPRPVERQALARVVGRDASIDLLIDDIREGLRGKPYDVVSVAGGWAFRTRTAYADAIATSAAVPDRAVDLTQNEAMVLVSIAYHQPVTRAGVSEILGREVSRDVIGALRDKNMITAGPRSPTAGAPFTYVTTKGFLEHFGLDTLRDLPGLEELEDAGLLGANVNEKVGMLGQREAEDEAEGAEAAGGKYGPPDF